MFRSLLFLLFAALISGCIAAPPAGSGTPVSEDTGSAADAGQTSDASQQDGGFATDLGGTDTGSAECPNGCDDGNPCTDDLCLIGECLNEPNDNSCDDGNPCTVNDSCSAGGCSGEQLVCEGGQICSNGTCACPEGQFSCEGTCIAMGTCCTDEDCDDETLSCPSPGGSCGCDAANPVRCNAGGACFPPGTCCNNSMCLMGQICEGAPGGECACPDGQKLCNNECIDENFCCENSDCTGGQVCAGGNCQCAVGQKDCNGMCVPESNCCIDADCQSKGRICNSGACVCRQDSQSCSDGNCYETCCPGTATMQACTPCGRQVCNMSGDGYDCVPSANSTCGLGIPCPIDFCAEGQTRQCMAGPNNPFRCVCSTCQ